MYRVLIVDDEYLIREGIVNSIDWKQLGFDLPAQASNGEEALSLIKGNPPDVLITDIKMPVMDGLGLIARVREFCPDLKIIILSGYGDFNYAQKAIEYSVYSYILKPLKKEEVNALLVKLSYELESNAKPGDAVNPAAEALYESRFEIVEHSLLKLISGAYPDIETCRKKIRKVWPNFPENSICTIACSYSSKHGSIDSDELWREVLDESNKYWKKYTYPVVLKDKLLYVIFLNNCELTRHYVALTIRQFKTYMEKFFVSSGKDDILINCGIGNCYRGLENLNNSYREATIALEFKFFTGKGSVIHYSEISNKRFKIPDHFIVEEAVSALVAAILGADLHNAVKHADTFLETMMASNFYDKNLMMLKCMDVFTEFAKSLNAGKLDNFLSREDEAFNDIYACEFYTDLCTCFKKHVIRLVNIVNYLRNSPENGLTVKIKQYVDANYNLRLSLKDLADVFQLNPSYISSLFKDITGMNLTDYIQNVRIQKAKRLLKDSDMQVVEIAEKVGFADYRYFCTVFKKEQGITPLQYRQKILV